MFFSRILYLRISKVAILFVGFTVMSDYKANLIIPGFPKTGTSSLHDYLNQHPEINMSKKKEPHFFSVDKQWKKGRAYYNELFDKSSNIVFRGESSTTYCIWPEAIRKISENVKSPKIIILLRDPVQRLISHYKWMYKLGLETDDILNAVERESMFDFHPDKPVHGCYRSYIEFSLYSKYIPLWTNQFGASSIYLVSSEQLLKDPLMILNNCFNFLGLSPLDTIDVINNNRTEEVSVVRSKLISHKSANRLRYRIPLKYQHWLRNQALIKFIWQRASLGKFLVVPSISDKDVRMLELRLKKEVAFYNDIFQRNLENKVGL